SAKSLTTVQFGPDVFPRCVQVLPPSIERKMPAPGTGEFLVFVFCLKKPPSPVPAKNVSGSVLNIPTMHVTARFDISSATGVQLMPPFSLRQMPPLTPPTNILSGAAGSIIMERIRPPMLPGPIHDQVT